jgi:hypothetical protein
MELSRRQSSIARRKASVKSFCSVVVARKALTVARPSRLLPQPMGHLLHCVSHFDDVVGAIECVVGHQLAALHRLPQGVVDVACHARSFRQPFVEAHTKRSRELVHSKAIERPERDAAHLTRTFYQMVGIAPWVLMRGEFFEIPSPFEVSGVSQPNA